MARNNYSYGKRQRELAKKKKKEQKRQEKLDRKNAKQEAPEIDAAPEAEEAQI